MRFSNSSAKVASAKVASNVSAPSVSSFILSLCNKTVVKVLVKYILFFQIVDISEV